MKKLLFLFVVLFAVACNTDDDPTPDGPEVTTVNNYLLKKTYLDGELFSAREYDSDSILLRINNYRDDTIWFYTAYEYLGDTVMTSFRQSNDELTNYRKTYELTDNTVRVDRFDDDDSFRNHTIYSYEGEDCGFSKIEKYDSNGAFSSSDEVVYTDENCSSLFTNFDADLQVVGNVEITLDDKHIYFYFPRIDLLRVNNLGSITEYKIWDEYGILVEENSYTAVIEYNDDDYPISITRNYLDGNIQVYTYEY